MKGKELREALKAGKAEAFERDPDLARGKKITGILLLIWAASRAFLLVMDLVCARIGFIESNPVNWVTMVILLLFAWWIYQGSGALAWLPIVGGVFMLISCVREKLFSLLGMDLDPTFRLYLIAYISAAVIQILVMVLILALPSCKNYAQTTLRITKELNGWQQEHRL